MKMTTRALRAVWSKSKSLAAWKKILEDAKMATNYRSDRVKALVIGQCEHHVFRATGNERTPEEWERLVAAIQDDDIRAKVASIVWWDFFSHRQVSERWPHLDKHMALYSRFQDYYFEDTKRELIRCGYPEKYATKRATTPFSCYTVA